MRKLYPCHSDYYQIGERCLNAMRDKTTYEDERFMQHPASSDASSAAAAA